MVLGRGRGLVVVLVAAAMVVLATAVSATGEELLVPDVRIGQESDELVDHSGTPKVSADGRWVVTVGPYTAADRTSGVLLADLDHPERVPIELGRTTDESSMSFAPLGNAVAWFGAVDGAVGPSLNVATLTPNGPVDVRQADRDLRFREDSQIFDFRFSPDGRFLLFRVNYEDDDNGRRRPILLWAIDLTDPDSRLQEVSRVEIIPQPPPEGQRPVGVNRFIVTEDSREVVFATDNASGSQGRFRMYRHQFFVGNGLSTQISEGSQPSRGDNFSGNIQFAGFTDGGRGVVVFAPPPGSHEGHFQVRDLDGTRPKRDVLAGAAGPADRPFITSDGEHLVWRGGHAGDASDALTSTLIAGETPPVLVGADIDVHQTGPGTALRVVGDRIVWRVGDSRIGGPPSQLHAARADGSGHVRLDRDVDGGEGVSIFIVGEDGRVVYAQQSADELWRYWVTDMTGGEPRMIPGAVSATAPQGLEDSFGSGYGSKPPVTIAFNGDGDRVFLSGPFSENRFAFDYVARSVDLETLSYVDLDGGPDGSDERFSYGVWQAIPGRPVVLLEREIRRDDRTDSYLFLGSRGHAARPVVDLSTADVGLTTIDVRWGASPGPDVVEHQLTVRPIDVAGAAPSVVTVGADVTSATLSGLAPNTRYEVAVVAVGLTGSRPAATTPATTLRRPSPTRPDGSGVVRVAGDDRYATAAGVALATFATAPPGTVYLAVGTDFPDALAGGPLAAADDAPILLVARTSLPKVTADALASLGPSRVVVLGGPVAVTDEVVELVRGVVDADVTRLSGDDRFATAAAVAAAMPATSDVVYLATGRNFPDALAAGPVTGGAPVLLTEPDRLPAATAAALGEVAPARVVALGGGVAVSDEVLAAAAAAAGGAETDRVSGPDRFATAVAVAALSSQPRVVYVAVGTNFPDALAAGPAAAANGAPILLTRPDGLPDITRDAIAGLDLDGIVLLGGTGAVTTTVQEQLAALLE